MNATEQKYKDLLKEDRPQVDPSVYTNSIFESEAGFRRKLTEYRDVILGSAKDDLRTTPIMYNRDRASRIIACTPTTGLEFGFCFEHKYTRECVLTVVISKDANWTYESSAKQDDGTFVERSAVLAAADTDELLNSIIAELTTDVAYYAGKRLTF